MSQLKCPYCGSIQIKAMANQPKKYPRPSDPIALAEWQKGYDCKKCGNDFVLQPKEPKKPAGFFKKLLGWILLLVIAFIVYAVISSPNDKASNKTEATTKVEQTHQEDPLKQEFSKEAEEAAHAYIPQLEENHQSIENSEDKNDTLSIKTTTRKSE